MHFGHKLCKSYEGYLQNFGISDLKLTISWSDSYFYYLIWFHSISRIHNFK